MAEKVENWLCAELGKQGIDASIEIAKYILSIDTAEDLDEYMGELLDVSNKKTETFIKELLVRWRPYHNSQLDNNVQVYKKADIEEEYISGRDKKRSHSSQKDKKQVQKNFLLNGYEVENRGILPGEERPKQQLPSPEKPRAPPEQEAKKKQKFVPLFSKEGQSMAVVQLPGRHVCECQAAKHKLINNCSRCGRVVCEQEGAGPCLYCGQLVCDRDDQEVLSRGSRKSEKLRQQLMKDMPMELLGKHMFDLDRAYLPHSKANLQESRTKAERHKEKLLEYDKTSARRTQVIDDEADYFATDSNQWLSGADREMLRKREEELRSKRYASRKDRTITLDFAGRQVLEEDPSKSINMYDVNDEIVQAVNFGARPKQKGSNKDSAKDVTAGDAYIINPNIQVTAPQFVPQDNSTRPSNGSKASSKSSHNSLPRIQDRELQEMRDEGMCMSMHQPWASLLTAGIKIHEGRSWYTSHRGRLWIAATAKAPEPEEIADLENSYKQLYHNKNLVFPSHYPVGCLLGCVDVTDCLSQDTYQEQFPDGESGSPFVFICDSPRELLVKFPIKGKHKIYKLEGQIHKAAKKGLR